MDNRPRDVREEILELVFPDLRYGGDPDIERYFDLRSSGRMLDALSVYRSRLRLRYPDDRKRVVLLSLYRQRSPSYPAYLKGLLMERADEIISRIRANIDAVTQPLERVDMGNTYGVLKAVEGVARLLPEEPEAAKAYVDTYEEYAKILNHRKKEMARASFLLSEFYKQTLAEDEEAPDFIASSLKAEEERRRRDKAQEERNFFDLSRIEFDAADVARIEIPKTLERDEDKTLAYCHKYWLRVDDPAFERIVWLYSRKYGTRHYDVFKAIKTGRRRKYADDEILSRVATTIADRYSYTVQGDLYMQSAWRRIKAGLYGGQSAARYRFASSGIAVPGGAAAGGAAASVPAATRAGPKRSGTGGDAAPPRGRGPGDAQDVPAGASDRLLRPSGKRTALTLERPAARAFEPGPAGGSISDRIKGLSGRAYDVYRDIFFSGVRPHIREALAKGASSAGGERLNQAEDAVYEFMERNYSNAYMDWQGSRQRRSLKDLGFCLDELDGIIEACYRKISA